MPNETEKGKDREKELEMEQSREQWLGIFLASAAAPRNLRWNGENVVVECCCGVKESIKRKADGLINQLGVIYSRDMP